MTHRKDASHFLAFDLGAESGRAVLGTLDGQRLTTHEVRRFPNTPLPLAGHIHWNVYALFDEMKAAMRDAAASIGARPDSLGVDTWGVDFGLLARDGRETPTPSATRWCSSGSSTRRSGRAYARGGSSTTRASACRRCRVSCSRCRRTRTPGRRRSTSPSRATTSPS